MLQAKFCRLPVSLKRNKMPNPLISTPVTRPILFCCISAEAYVQETLQIFDSRPPPYKCQRGQPQLILSLNRLDEGNSRETH